MNSIIRLISSIIVWIVLAFLLVLFIAFYGVGLLGYSPHTVLGASMEPAIPVGSMAYVQKVDPYTLDSGDVITFNMGTDLDCTHRVVSADYDNQCFVTKGDANSEIDPGVVSFSNLKGKVVFAIPVLGFVNVWLHSDAGRMIVLGLAAVFVFFIFLSSYQPKQKEKDEEKEGEQQSESKGKTNL